MENRYMGVSSLSWAQYLMEDVEVTPKKSGTFSLSSGQSITLEEGKKTTIKRWAARELAEFLEVHEEALSPKEVALSAWKEENDARNLKKIDPLFYSRASDSMTRGGEKELRASISELLSVRKRKIMEAAVTGRDDAEFYDSMTAEERKFYDDLKRCVDGWQEFLVLVLSGISPVEGGGEVGRKATANRR